MLSLRRFCICLVEPLLWNDWDSGLLLIVVEADVNVGEGAFLAHLLLIWPLLDKLAHEHDALRLAELLCRLIGLDG